MTIQDLGTKFNLADKYSRKMESYYRELAGAGTTKEKLVIISQLYNYIKHISLDFYCPEEDKMNDQFSGILKMVLYCERLLPQEYVMDIMPKYNYLEKEYRLPSNHNDKMLLDYIVARTRNYLYDKKIRKFNLSCSLAEVDLQCECIVASTLIDKICEELSIKSRKVLLCTGFTDKDPIYKGVNLHWYNIIELNGKEYLIDCTYSQFFMLKRCLIERIGIVGLLGCQAGIFMTMTEERRKVAQRVLKEGWIELKENVLKNYLDGFAISYRNGLYYEKTNDFSYETNYSDNDYRKFLSGEDSQMNHESKLVLGLAPRPLSNPNLKFSKR